MYGQCTLYRAVWVVYFVAKYAFIWFNLDILFSGCPKWNIEKQNGINIINFSILCIHEYEKGNIFSRIFIY